MPSRRRPSFVRNQRQGQLHGRPESGLVSRHLMNGVGRCFECGGPLIFVHRGAKHAHRYYCSHRCETGRCKNGRGILKKALDDAVRLRLDALLSEDEELHWQLLDERITTARPAQGVANTQAELARIDGEVERLVAPLAAGSKSAAVIGEITKREPAIEALKVKLSSPEAPARPRAAAGRRPPAGCCRNRCGTPCPSSPRSAPPRAA